jgi:hypothetical protein
MNDKNKFLTKVFQDNLSALFSIMYKREEIYKIKYNQNIKIL